VYLPESAREVVEIAIETEVPTARGSSYLATGSGLALKKPT
jgi:hypothetical protein